jgi:quercetin dioxygenase-like cupin family protein
MASDERVGRWGSVTSGKGLAMRDGIVRRTLAFTNQVHLVHWTIRRGVVFGEHTHLYEQAGYVLRGRVRMVVDGEARDLGPGEAYAVPAGVPHDAEALEDVEILDVFSPAREEYLD